MGHNCSGPRPRHTPPCLPRLFWLAALQSSYVLNIFTWRVPTNHQVKHTMNLSLHISVPTPILDPATTSLTRQRRASLSTTSGRCTTTTATTTTATTPSLTANLPRESTKFCCPTEEPRS